MASKNKIATLYEQTVNQIKHLKKINQHISSFKTDTAEQQTLFFDVLKTQETQFIAISRQVSNSIRDLQEKYLDPETAGKIALLTKHFQGQLDRNTKMRQQTHKTFQQTVEETWSTQQNKENRNKETRSNSVNSATTQETLGECFDYEVESRLATDRHSSFKKIQENLQNVHSVAKQTAELTYKQGEDLDLIEEQLNKTHDNVKDSNKYLEEAEVEQKKGNRKYVYCGLAVVVLVAIAISVVIFLL